MGEAASRAANTNDPRDQVPAWAGAPMRVDPYQLPLRVAPPSCNGTSYTIGRQGAVVRTRLRCGLTVSMALPARAFKGVAAHAEVTSQGFYRVSLELHHNDPDLCVPLLVSEDLDDIAADWHSWSRLMKLPMLILEGRQNAVAVRTMLGEIMVEDPLERRKRRQLAKRRSRFLQRRKPGTVSEVVRLTGEELIARR